MALSVKVVKNQTNNGALWQSQVTSQVVEGHDQKDLFIPFQAISESEQLETDDPGESFHDELSALSAEQQPDANWQPLIPVSVEELTEAQSRIAEGLDQVLIPNSGPTSESMADDAPRETNPSVNNAPEPPPPPPPPPVEMTPPPAVSAAVSEVPSPTEEVTLATEKIDEPSDTESANPDQNDQLENLDESTRLDNEAILSAYKAELEAEYAHQHAENEAALQQQKQQLENITTELSLLLTNLQGTIQHYYDEQQDALLKLSTHIARQLVRAELTLSSSAIDSLIKASLEFFSNTDGLKVFLNPIDKELLEKHNSLPEDYLVLSDEELSPGSVRISNAERHTEDLIVDRLSEITEQIFESVEAHLLEPITHLEKTNDN